MQTSYEQIRLPDPLADDRRLPRLRALMQRYAARCDAEMRADGTIEHLAQCPSYPRLVRATAAWEGRRRSLLGMRRG